METGKRVQILLSTYNGEKYLREQLDSYLAMEDFDQCAVLIRDDGSTDHTCEILSEYAEREKFQIVYGENLGWIGSYQWLIQHSDPMCRYFAFSDQDDIWLPDKMKKALALLDNCPPGQMALFASRSCVTDENLKPLGESIAPVRGVSYYNAMVQNVLPGHTQVFNCVLRDSIVQYGFAQAVGVDWWIYLLGSALGTVAFEPSCTVLHRQHGNNTVGYQLGFWGSLRKKLRYIRQGKGNSISFQIQSFYLFYYEQMPEEYRQETERYLEGLKSLPARLRYLTSCRVYRQEWQDDWKFRLLYLLGKYNLPCPKEHGV